MNDEFVHVNNECSQSIQNKTTTTTCPLTWNLLVKQAQKGRDYTRTCFKIPL